MACRVPTEACREKRFHGTRPGKSRAELFITLKSSGMQSAYRGMQRKRFHATRPGKSRAVGVSGRSGSLVTQALSQLVVEVGIFLTRPQRTLAHPGPLAL